MVLTCYLPTPALARARPPAFFKASLPPRRPKPTFPALIPRPPKLEPNWTKGAKIWDPTLNMGAPKIALAFKSLTISSSNWNYEIKKILLASFIKGQNTSEIRTCQKTNEEWLPWIPNLRNIFTNISKFRAVGKKYYVKFR